MTTSPTRTPESLRQDARAYREAAEHADSRDAYRADMERAADLEHEATQLEQQLAAATSSTEQ